MYKNKKIGQSLVEFAILTPFVVLILATILELAPFVNAYMKVEKATHAAARTGAIYGTTDNEILETLVINMFGMSFPEFYDGYVPATKEVHFRAKKISNPGEDCTYMPGTTISPHEKFNPAWNIEFPTEHCFSESFESFAPDPRRTSVMITPTIFSRVNGSWVSVNVRYNYRVYTPVLYFFADIMFANKTTATSAKTIPIYKFSTQRIE